MWLTLDSLPYSPHSPISHDTGQQRTYENGNKGLLRKRLTENITGELTNQASGSTLPKTAPTRVLSFAHAELRQLV